MQTILKYFRKRSESRSVRALSLGFFALLIAWLAFLVLAAAVSVGEESSRMAFGSSQVVSKSRLTPIRSVMRR